MTKPSDTAERRRERKREYDRRKRRGRLVDDANALAAKLSDDVRSYFCDRVTASDLPYARGQTPFAVFHRLLEDLVGRNLDIWKMITGETRQSLSKAQRLALGAYLADRERAGREGRRRVSPTASWTGFRAGEPWIARLTDQLQAELEWGRELGEDILDYWDTMALMCAFATGVRRYGKRRKLKLRDGGTKVFVIWPTAVWGEAASTGCPLSSPALIPLPDGNFAPITDPVLPSREKQRLWISQKALERENRVSRAFSERRRTRLPILIQELQEIARSQGRIYIPPPRKTAVSPWKPKPRPARDLWQVAAEESRKVVNGWVDGRLFVASAAWRAQKVREHVSLYLQADKLAHGGVTTPDVIGSL